jgi:single-stranded DNA-binding protein
MRSWHICNRTCTPRRSGIESSRRTASASRPLVRRKGDHVYVEGTLMSRTYRKELGKAKNKATVPLKTWEVKADSIRKLNGTKKDQVLDTAPLGAQPEEVSF